MNTGNSTTGFSQKISENMSKIYEWNLVVPYSDFHSGELERLRNDVRQLQEINTMLISYLAANDLIDLDLLAKI